jgi:hypothetical protein
VIVFPLQCVSNAEHHIFSAFLECASDKTNLLICVFLIPQKVWQVIRVAIEKDRCMRAICVDGKRRAEDIGNEPLLNEGDVYIVEDEVFGTTSKGQVVDCYKLHGIDFPHVYVKNRFVVCSNGPEEMEDVQIEREMLTCFDV